MNCEKYLWKMGIQQRNRIVGQMMFNVISPHCPSNDDWINKMQYIHTLEYCLVVKGNGALIQAAAQVNRENMPSERRQSERAVCIKCLEQANLQKQNMQWLPRAAERQKGKLRGNS